MARTPSAGSRTARLGPLAVYVLLVLLAALLAVGGVMFLISCLGER